MFWSSGLGVWACIWVSGLVLLVSGPVFLVSTAHQDIKTANTQNNQSSNNFEHINRLTIQTIEDTASRCKLMANHIIYVGVWELAM